MNNGERIRGQEFHSIIEKIFDDVNGINVSEQVQVNCPRCQETDGLPYPDGKFNLEINVSKRVFRCWRCDFPKFSGSLGKLIRLYGSKSDYEIYKAYAGAYEEYHETDDDDDEFMEMKLPEEMIYFSDMEAGNIDHFEAYNYLVNTRKLNRELILRYKLGFCVSGKYINRIIIPSFDSKGRVNYFVSRTYDPTIKKNKYDNPKSDKDKIIFNEGLINWDSTVFLVEGVFEMFRITNAIPLLGKTISSALCAKLKEHVPEIIIILDPDAYKNALELFYILNSIYAGYEEKIRIIKLPNNDDLDELYVKYGTDALKSILREARLLNVDDYFHIKLYDPTKQYNKFYKKHNTIQM